MKIDRRAGGLLGALLLMLAAAGARADDVQFGFKAPATIEDASMAPAIRDLAGRVLPVYQDPDIVHYLANLSMLQLAAGNGSAAWDTRQSLLDRQQKAEVPPPARALALDLYVHANALESGTLPFDRAFAQAFDEEVPKLDDLAALELANRLGESADTFRAELQESLDRAQGRDSISLDEAVSLVRRYIEFEAWSSFAPVAPSLVAADTQQRYATDDDVSIDAGRGVELHARWVRPKRASGRLPTLLEFTILMPGEDMQACAAHGYVCVVAWTRGRNPHGSARNHERIMPFEHDGEDARAVIGWIARQSWSDGRVGMIGDGYAGFAAWAAATHAPAALKAIATSDPMAPGIDFPMRGRIFTNGAFRWATEHTREVDDTTHDGAFWRALDLRWYRSGKPFDDLDQIAGLPNRVFRRWLDHPSDNRYWQTLVPSAKEFAGIEIPALTMTGYYSRGEAGALFYAAGHGHGAAAADDRLLIGPWDDRMLRTGVVAGRDGYVPDASARLDLRALRYDWLDHVFKGGALPAPLAGRVNYELMGADSWRQAASVGAIAGGSLRLYAVGSKKPRLLRKPSNAKYVEQKVDLTNRSDAEIPATLPVAGSEVPARNSVTFRSDPLKAPLEIAGELSGRLDLRINKMDADLDMTLYEQKADGSILRLFDPCILRASYAADSVHRRLLKAGERQRLLFRCKRIAGSRLAEGSRIVFVLGIEKRPDREINYGSGKDVAEASIADAGAPLTVRWYGDSYIDVPIRR